MMNGYVERILAGNAWEMPAGLTGEWPLATNGNDIIGTAHLTANNMSYSGGWAIFNGSNGYYDIPAGAYPTKNTDWSLEIWINADVLDKQIDSVINSSPGVQRQISINSGSINFYYRGVDTLSHHATYSFTPSTGIDYQIIITHEHGVETKIYVGGTLRDTDTYTGDESSGFNLGNYLGQQAASSSVFDGKMRTRRLWQGTVLSPAQISGLWNGGSGR